MPQNGPSDPEDTPQNDLSVSEEKDLKGFKKEPPTVLKPIIFISDVRVDNASPGAPEKK